MRSSHKDWAVPSLISKAPDLYTVVSGSEFETTHCNDFTRQANI